MVKQKKKKKNDRELLDSDETRCIVRKKIGLGINMKDV